MSDFTVTIDGVEELSRRLQIEGGLGGNPLRDGMAAAAFDTVQKVQLYPPVPKNSSYVRTGALYHSWTREVSDSGLEAKIGSKIPYAPYVQGRMSQTWYHRRTGWKLAEVVVEQNIDRIKKIITGFIQARLDGKA